MTKQKLGNCYQNAASIILDGPSGIMALRRPEQYVLVHGEPRYKGEPGYEGTRLVNTGDRFGHAWVESGGIVFDVTTSVNNPTLMDRERYYALGDIDPATCRYYTRDEVLKMLVRYEHYGPWESLSTSRAPKRKKKVTTPA